MNQLLNEVAWTKLENVHGEGLLVAVLAAFIAVPALINWDFACDAITVDLV